MGDDRLILDDFIPYRLAHASGLVSETIARTYRALFGIAIPEWRIIAHVAAEPGISQQAIGRRSRMDKVTVSRAAIALAARGLVARGADPTDRRARRLVLTAEGEALYSAIAPKALEMERALLAGFTADELDLLTAMLRRIDAAAGAMTPGSLAD